MEEQALSRIIEILETDPDFFVPVERLWLTLRREGLLHDLDLEDFRQILKQDKRFEFIPVSPRPDGPDFDLWVKLASRPVTVADVFAAMSRQLVEMNTALQEAWERRPKGDLEVETQLLDILTTGRTLMSELQELLSHREEI